MHGRRFAALACPWAVLLTVSAGCDTADGPAAVEPAAVASDAGRAFDPAGCGTIVGRVVWDGAVPEVPPFRAPLCPGTEWGYQPRRLWPNVLAPRVDPASRGVAGAVIVLGGIDPRRGRPWDHSDVRIELDGYRIDVCGNGGRARFGFVRRGAVVAMVSRLDHFESLQGRGAAYFSLTFPDADRPRVRRFDRPGVVELSSGAGHFWMRAHLFVSDHPYLAASGGDGTFTLPQVPAGEYELACWHPNWIEADRDLDGETALVTRMTFRPPVEQVRRVRVPAGGTAEASFTLREGDFVGPR